MKKLFTTLLALLALVGVKANDGAFYSQGNQLIPITESTIRVQMEILTITLDQTGKGLHRFKVNVYYEFFNPGPAKDLLVGFEAITDDNAVTHPYIHDFKVVMNDRELPHEVSRFFYPINKDNQLDFEIKNYYKNGHFVEPTEAMWKAMKDPDSPYYYYEEVGMVPYYFVYHFNAHFNPGLNIIRHTYDFFGSDLVQEEYLFNYVLTAAKRWANNGIDDFTLEINMGDRQSFSVQPTFFKNANEWTFTGKGKVDERKDMLFVCEDCPMFHVQSGSIVFRKKHFHPEGELFVVRDSFYISESFDYRKKEERSIYDPEGFVEGFKTQYCNLALDPYDNTPINMSNMTAEQKRILKNIPFAYRGYVFKNQDVQRYFNSTDWYVPNPEYKSDMTTLSKGEKDWVQLWSK